MGHRIDTEIAIDERGDLPGVDLRLLALWVNRDDPAGAVARFEEALSIVRDIGDRDQEALVLSNLGGALLEIGSFDDAMDRLDEALHGFERSGEQEIRNS